MTILLLLYLVLFTCLSVVCCIYLSSRLSSATIGELNVFNDIDMTEDTQKNPALKDNGAAADDRRHKSQGDNLGKRDCHSAQHPESRNSSDKTDCPADSTSTYS